MSSPTISSTAGNCANCGADNPSAARYCMACGAGLVRLAAPAGGLRFVSVVCCDVVGSTGLAVALQPDRWAAVLDGYFSLVGSLVERHGGKVEKFIGDAVVAVFGVDAHGESAAATAVSAASAIVRGTRQYAAELGELLQRDFPVRVAVASGHVAVSARTSSFVIGAVLNRAARLQAHAPDDGVIVDLATRLQLPDHWSLRAVGPIAAKGFTQEVPAWVVGPAAVARRPETAATVGRAGLVGELTAALGAAPGLALIVVDGASGVGKSRLVDEVLGRCADCARVVLHCPPVGAGLGLLACYLLLEAIEDAARRGLDRVDVTAHLAGPSTPAESAPAQDRRELGRALAEALEGFQRSRPLVLVVEHSERTPEVLADLLADLLGRPPAPPPGGTADGAPHADAGARRGAVLLVGVTAPAALAEQADLRLTVPPLGRRDARRLAGQLLTAHRDTAPPAPGADSAEAVAGEIARRAGGNPLYIEQMVALRRFAQPGDDWAPPSAHAALGARLDQLDAGAGRLLVLLAAAGRGLSLEDLGTLMPSDQVTAAAAALLEAGLLDAAGTRQGRLAPAFPVLAEVALHRLTLAESADVHTRLALALEPVAKQRPAVAELLAGHWESAHAALRGVEPRSTRTATAAGAAVTALGTAARFTLSRGRPEGVPALTERARRLAAEDSAESHGLDVLEAYALGSRGRPQAALERVQRVLAAAPAPAAPAAGIHARLNALYASTYLTGAPSALVDLDDPAYLAAVASSDPEARVGAHLYAGLRSLRSGDHPAAERALRSALLAAGGGRHWLGLTEVYANLAMALVNGDTPVPRALADCERLHREVAGSRLLTSATGVALGLVQDMAGDHAAATSAMGEAEQALHDLGQGTGAATIAGWRAVLAARSGEWLRAAHWSTVQANRCDLLGMVRQASIARLQAESARAAAGAEPLDDPRARPAIAAAVGTPAEAWGEYSVILQARAARALELGDRETAAACLDTAVGHLAAVRGSRAGCLRRRPVAAAGP